MIACFVRHHQHREDRSPSVPSTRVRLANESAHIASPALIACARRTRSTAWARAAGRVFDIVVNQRKL